jgi:uncharacterized membrane protein
MKWGIGEWNISKPVLRTEIHEWLAASMGFSVLLVFIRIVATSHLTFIFLVWNLFLAYIPYCISSFMQNNPSWVKNRWKFVIGFLGWLFFIPNSFYIITDLFHLGINTVPIWFDLAMLLSFAWNGLLLGILSVYQIEKIVKHLLPRYSEIVFVLPVMFLNALGLYVGRYLRFNSWDIISNPFTLMREISNMLLYPFHYKPAWAMILCYSVLISFIYLTVKRISKTITSEAT